MTSPTTRRTDDICQSKATFEAYIREFRRPDIGDEADEMTEADFILDLAEDGWPDHCRWSKIWCRVHEGGELTAEERRKSLAYWAAGEEYPAEEDRLEPNAQKCGECMS